MTLDNFKKISLPSVHNVDALPDDFPQKKDYQDRHKGINDQHISDMHGFFHKYFPDKEKGFIPKQEDISGIKEKSFDTFHQFKAEHGQIQVKNRFAWEKFDKDLTKHLSEYKGKQNQEVKDKSKSEVDVDGIRREYQRQREQDPINKVDRQLRNQIDYTHRGDTTKEVLKDRYNNDPKFRQKRIDQSTQQNQKARSTNRGRVKNNFYVREVNRVKNNPLSNCSDDCGDIKKVHYDNFKHDFDKEWDSLKFTDKSESTIKGCKDGCLGSPDNHFSTWYRGRQPKTSFVFFKKLWNSFKVRF